MLDIQVQYLYHIVNSVFFEYRSHRRELLVPWRFSAVTTLKCGAKKQYGIVKT